MKSSEFGVIESHHSSNVLSSKSFTIFAALLCTGSQTVLCPSYVVAPKTTHSTEGEATPAQGRVGQSLPSPT